MGPTQSPMNTSDKVLTRLDYIYKLLMVLALVITATILASDIIVPILVAGILAVVMYPLVKRLEKKMAPVLAVTIVLFGSFLLFVMVGWLVVSQVGALVRELPSLENKFTLLIDQVSTTLQETLGMSALDQNQMLKSGITSMSGYVTGLLATTTNILTLIIQIPIYVFLFLIYRDRFKRFLLNMLPASEEPTWRKEIENVIQGYISGLILVTVIIAALNSIGLLILGIDHAIFFGILSGVLTIIPYVGIFIGAAFPVLMAFLTKDSMWYPLGVILIFSFVQFLEGNFITPRITGSRVSINALAAIIALLIGGKILGIAGMILAVPMLGIIKILLGHTVYLKPFVILIEDTPPKPVLPPEAPNHEK